MVRYNDLYKGIVAAQDKVAAGLTFEIETRPFEGAGALVSRYDG